MAQYGITAEALPKGGAPVDQRSFGTPTAEVAPLTPTAPTFVPGVGMLGADLGGMVKGDQAAQDFRLKDAENVRADQKLGMDKVELGMKSDYLAIAQEDLGIRKEDLKIRQTQSSMEVATFKNAQEKFDWERTAHTKQQELTAGMENASRENGYTGVIDFLKTRNPVMAIQFHAAKLQLDNSIMSNEVMQVKTKNESSQAMFDSYAVLGKMGSSLMAAAPEDRETMYQQILPMVRKVVPDAPDNIEEATPMFLLGISQATPANQLASMNVNTQKSVSKSGKLYDDLSRAKTAGDAGKVDFITKAIQAESEKFQDITINKTKVELSQSKTKMDATMKVSAALASVSKPFTENMENFKKVKLNLELLAADPNNGTAMAQLKYGVVRLSEKGPLTKDDLDRTSGVAGYNNYSKQVESFFTGDNITLIPKEIAQVRAMSEVYMKDFRQQQVDREQSYQKMTSSPSFNGLVDWKDVPKPSEIYDKMTAPAKQASQEDIQAAMSDPQARQEFIDYFGEDQLPKQAPQTPQQ